MHAQRVSEVWNHWRPQVLKDDGLWEARMILDVAVGNADYLKRDGREDEDN